jgi:hypothetical protein
MTPEQFAERFDMLQHVTEAHDAKQKAALVSSLRTYPRILARLPSTVQDNATALKQQLLQHLGVDPEQTQQLISRQPRVLEFQAHSLVQKVKKIQGKKAGSAAGSSG